MKFSSDEEVFTPFSISIESRKEAAMLYLAISSVGFGKIREAESNSYYKIFIDALKSTNNNDFNVMVNTALDGIRESCK